MKIWKTPLPHSDKHAALKDELSKFFERKKSPTWTWRKKAVCFSSRPPSFHFQLHIFVRWEPLKQDNREDWIYATQFELQCLQSPPAGTTWRDTRPGLPLTLQYFGNYNISAPKCNWEIWDAIDILRSNIVSWQRLLLLELPAPRTGQQKYFHP